MAQSRKQYEDALGSIFDFIFQQSQQPPHRRKPVKLTGIDGTSEIVQSLAAVLENPGVFMNEVTMDSFSEFINVDLAKIQLGDRGGAISFNLNDLGSLLRDPSAYVDSLFAKMEGIRKMQRFAHGGESMKSLMAGAWARKSGLDSDAQRAVTNIGRPDAFRTELMARNTELMERKFGSRTGVGISLSALERHYGRDQARVLFNRYSDAKQAFDQRNQARVARDTRKLNEAQKVIDGFSSDSELYASLEAEELRRKAMQTNDREKQLEYIRAARFVDHMGEESKSKIFSEGRRRAYIKETNTTIKAKRQNIENLRRRGAPSSEIQKERKAIRGLKSNIRTTKTYEFASSLGDFEGRYYSVKGMFFEGQLVPYLINGKFFDSRFNSLGWLQPTKEKSQVFSSWGKDRLRASKKAVGIEFKVAKDSKTGRKTYDAMVNKYTQGMTDLYYLSPSTLAKSLVTGEVFAYNAFKTQKNLINFLDNDVVRGIQGFNVNEFIDAIKEGTPESYLRTLEGVLGEDAINRVNKLAGRLKRQSNNAYRFSAVSRARDKLKNIFDRHIGSKVRGFIGNKILLKAGFIASNTVAATAIKSWIKTGGLYTVVKTTISAALQAIGFSVAGPLGNIVATALTWLATDVLMKLAKPFFKFAANAIKYSLIGIIAFFVIVIVFFFMIYGQHSHVSPGDCIDCEAWGGHKDYYKYGPDDYECYSCDGEAFKAVSGMPSYDSIPDIAKQYFATQIRPKITEELMEVYAKIEEATGIPCEIVAAVHFMEAGMDPNKSLYDGGSLRAPTLLEDGIGAMNHLKGKMGGNVPSDYETLINGLGDYNGPGNRNCSSYQGVMRPTRWRTSTPTKCPASQAGPYYDHIYPLNWISDKHTDMDLIYCKDGVEFSCNTTPGASVPADHRVCYKGAGTVCNAEDTNNNSTKYPLFKRPGVITVAIMMHNESSSNCDGGGGGGSPGSRVVCESGDTLDDLLQKNIQKFAAVKDLSGSTLQLIDCPGHSSCGLIGTAWCWASNPILCKRDKIEGAMATNCNYVSDLICHELVHHIQGVRDSRLVREWGADYICNNGGGYRFTDTTGECKRATQIVLPSACSGQVAIESAYVNTSYPGVSQCLNALNNQISFCN